MPKSEIIRRSWNTSAAKPKVETRGDDKAPVIVGYAAVFHRADDPGTEFRLWSDTYERIMPGAFDAAIKEQDLVRALFNHDPNQVLGRSDNGKLRLSVDAVGLRYEIDPPDTQAGRDVLALLERGDIDGSSFGFRLYGGVRGKVTWVEETRNGRTVEVRQIEDLELIDVGPVTFPAYEATEAGVRMEDDVQAIRRERDEWRACVDAPDMVRELDLRLREAEAWALWQ